MIFRLRDGDRFYFGNTFLESEIEVVEEITLAKIIKRNTKLSNIQDFVFIVPATKGSTGTTDTNFDELATPAVEEGQYPNKVSLLGDNYVLHWKMYENQISIAVEVKTSGWIGLGFGPKEGMVEADIVLGRVVNGKVEVADYYSFDNGAPSEGISKEQLSN